MRCTAREGYSDRRASRYRRDARGPWWRRVDVYAYLLEGRQDDDVRLEEGDVVIVRLRAAGQRLGKVKRPMHYEMKRGETLGRLLDYAGGFTGDAYSKELRVIRETGREYRLYNVREGRFRRMDAGGRRRGDCGVRSGPLRQPRGGPRLGVPGGMYELSDEMHTVRALIERAEGLEGDAFTGRAQLFLREREDLSLELLSLDLGGIMSGAFRGRGAAAQRRLSFRDTNWRSAGPFTIGGEVARPGGAAPMPRIRRSRTSWFRPEVFWTGPLR